MKTDKLYYISRLQNENLEIAMFFLVTTSPNINGIR